ncbi:MAG: serine/threonine-protein kinase, partial [Planctomycetaceae bacterium]|nr:serine/threonine-protein kinase [Planctomycetaceae bacterium]
MTEETLFHEALAKPPDERAAFLDAACAAQPELRAAVEALLAAHEASGPFLDQPATPSPLPLSPAGERGRGEGAAAPERTGAYTPRAEDAAHRAPPLPKTTDYQSAIEPGAVIAGRYTLVEKIGEGGMGEVWVAKQTEPVKRKVALKLIKTGMDSKAVLARFEQERQALALMDHPHIARVLDGGMTPTGQPFFVMELVNGLPLTKFCDEAKLTPKDRLQLFVPICQAVQHAHQKGIVHRDLKPANILVALIDGKPAPKVIDFGLAKATGGKLTDESMSTQFGAVVGTLEYLSPEQAGFSGIDVDTRADIYSLGVILYELLTGLRPINAQRLRKAAHAEMIRIIQEEEPSKPSTRLSTDEALPSLAALRQTEPKKLMAMLRGELDWVVMKCLEKQRERRYETANGLARDIQRYLADEAVEACPPTAGYRLRKFVRKHRAAVLTAAALIGMLVLGVTVSSWLAVRATQAEARARANEQAALAAAQAEARERQKATTAESAARLEADKAKAINNFLINDLLAEAAPENNPVGNKVTVRELLDKAALKIGTAFTQRPEPEAAIRKTIGRTYMSLGLYGEAERHLREALNLYRQIDGPEHPDTLNVMNVLVWSLMAARKRDEAEKLYWQAKYPEAERLYREVLEIRKRSFGPEHPATLNAIGNLVLVLDAQGKQEEAMPLAEKTLEGRRRVLGPEHAHTLSSLSSLAGLQRQLGKVRQAEGLFRELAEASSRTLGAEHDLTLMAQTNLAQTLASLGRLAEAEPLFRQGLAARSRLLGPEHQLTQTSIGNLAGLLHKQGRLAEAEGLYRKTLENQAKLGREDPYTFWVMNNLADLLLDKGKAAEAEPLCRAAVEGRRKLLPPGHRSIAYALVPWARLFVERGDLDRAEPVLREALEIFRNRPKDGDWEPAYAQSLLGRWYAAKGNHAEAEPLLL